MGITSLQVCMDSSDWLQGTIHEENGMDSSSPMSGDILTCSRPLIERRLRPPHDLALKCPRCESTHTKFCYYNNYSLSQPRYFCKTCRRYWTKGGTLRNIPVGGGCRKNKKVSSKKSNSTTTSNEMNPASSTTITNINNPTDLQLSFPEMPFPPHHHFANFNHFGGNLNPSAFMLENPVPIHDFMESKYDLTLVGSSSRNQDFLGNGDIGMMNSTTGFGHEFNNNAANFCSPFGMTSSTIDGNNFGNINMDASHHMLPYQNHHQNGAVHEDVKPNPKLLSLEWHHEQGCSDVGKESFGYLGAGLGSWTGLMNGYGSSATNPLV